MTAIGSHRSLQKERKEKFALLKRAMTAIGSHCSLQKEQKEKFALLNRAKERFALFCQKSKGFATNSQPYL